MLYLFCLLVCSVAHLCVGQQPETLTGLFTIEQPGTGDCMTLDRAAPGMDDDRVVLARCRDNPDDSQQFTVDAVLDEERTHFSIQSSDSKCFFGDNLNELRRSESLCDKTLNYFLADQDQPGASRRGRDITIKHWPSNMCLTSHLDGTITLSTCDPTNPRQKWKVCRNDDSESCLRFY